MAIVMPMKDSAVDHEGRERFSDSHVRRGTTGPVIPETTSEWVIRQSPSPIVFTTEDVPRNGNSASCR